MKKSHIFEHDSRIDLKEFRRVLGNYLHYYIENKMGPNLLVGLTWHDKPGEFGWILEYEAA